MKGQYLKKILKHFLPNVAPADLAMLMNQDDLIPRLITLLPLHFLPL